METNSGISLGLLDVGLFVLALAISVLIGVYFANKNKTIEEYMLGGRDQSLLPVSMSMMTSFISGLTLIGGPAELYYHGPSFALNIIGMLLSVPFSAILLMPVFYRLGGVSVFGYLELRFNRWVKRITSLTFMLQMTLYNAVVLYVPSLSLQSVLGISDAISIGAVGVSCLVYSTLGGIKAVIWTDFFQAGLMYLSLLCICVTGTLQAGGFWPLIEINQKAGRLSLDSFLNLDLETRHTLYNIATGGVIINVFMNGANQIQVQRALSLPTLRLAQCSQLLTIIFTISISLIASYIGLILTANYQNCDPYTSKAINKRDTVLIYYVASKMDHLPGFRGIFVAGIFAATLSTLSSFQNSMSALMLEDFIKPALKKSPSDKTITLWSKLIALAFGLSCIGLTFIVGRVSGLLQIAYTLFGALGAPFLAAFIMGMSTTFANTIGMLTGMICGFIFGTYIQVYQLLYMPPLNPSMPISTEFCDAYAANNSQLISHTDHLSSPLGGNNVSSIIRQFANDNHGWHESDFGRMSYFWLPVFSLALTIFVSTLVSLLTSGWKQKIDDKYLIGWLHCSDQLKSNSPGNNDEFLLNLTSSRGPRSEQTTAGL